MASDSSLKCPICRKTTRREDNPFFPFCSERCQLRDLGKWLDGSYGVPGDPAPLPGDGLDGETPQD